MIKVLGFGRRSPSLSHAACITYHRETHSKLGLEQAAHFGKYVLYYFNEARSGDGVQLDDLPWDMLALEWFLEEARWRSFQQWLTSAPDGKAAKADEEEFLEREKCYMVACDEHVAVERTVSPAEVNIVRVLRHHGTCEMLAARRHHETIITPLVQEELGPALRRFAAYYVTEATCLASGPVQSAPMDVIELYKLDPAQIDSLAAFGNALDAPTICTAEEAYFGRDSALIFGGEEIVYF